MSKSSCMRFCLFVTWNVYTIVFFPFLFSSYCCFIDSCVVSGHCNQFSIAFFYVVFEMSNQCINTIFNAGEALSFSCLYHLWNVRSYASSWVFCVLWSICWSSSLIHFKNSPKYLTRGTAQVFIPLIRFQLWSSILSSFLILLRYSLLMFSFISSCLISAFNIPKYL